MNHIQVVEVESSCSAHHDGSREEATHIKYIYEAVVVPSLILSLLIFMLAYVHEQIPFHVTRK